MSLWKTFWRDESGSVVSAEAVVVGAVGLAGATAGLSATHDAIDQELRDVARSLRSLDQSYTLQGFTGSTAWTGNSAYRQQDVAKSLAELDALERQWAERRTPPDSIATQPERPAGDAADQHLEPDFPAAL